MIDTKTKNRKMNKTLLFLLLFFCTLLQTAYAQSPGITVRGNIKDVAGKGLAGVSVNEKGTRNGTTTNDDGSFTIRVAKQNSALVISSVGFQPKEVVVGNSTSLSVQLENFSEEMQQVVVVGYG